MIKLMFGLRSSLSEAHLMVVEFSGGRKRSMSLWGGWDVAPLQCGATSCRAKFGSYNTQDNFIDVFWNQLPRSTSFWTLMDVRWKSVASSLAALLSIALLLVLSNCNISAVFTHIGGYEWGIRWRGRGEGGRRKVPKPQYSMRKLVSKTENFGGFFRIYVLFWNASYARRISKHSYSRIV